MDIGTEPEVDRRKVRSTFSTLADDWDDKNSHIEAKTGVSNRMTTLLREHIGPATRVLDVGCGTGKVYEIVREQISSTAFVTMADISEAMCERARGKSASDPAATVIHADPVTEAARLGPAHDVVTMLQLLHHVPDPGALLRAVRDLVRPGGVLIALCIGERYHEEVFAFHRDRTDAVGRRTLDQWRGLFEEAGLDPVTVVEDRFEVSYRDDEAYSSFLDAVGVTRKINGYSEPLTVRLDGASGARDAHGDGSLRLTGQHYTLTYRAAGGTD